MARTGPSARGASVVAVALLASCTGAFSAFGALSAREPAPGEVDGRRGEVDARTDGRETGPRRRSFFETHVRPVLNRSCLRCHGAIRRKAELDLRTEASARAGGESGPGAVGGDPEGSRLWRLIQKSADPHMPPDGQLDERDLLVVRTWIERLRPPGSEAEPANARDLDRPLPVALETPRWAPPLGVTPRLTIDLLLERRWHREGVRPSPPADDRLFARRAFVDLVGRVPTPDELAEFLGTTDSSKRETLIDSLLRSPEHARHLAEVLTVALLGRADERRDRERRERGWLEWLRSSIASNRPWDQVVGDLIVARPTQPGDTGAVAFLHERRNQHAEIASATSAALFGVRMECAQCHDHPLAPEILQAHYWGLTAFFSRSKNVDTPAGPRVAESAIGGFSKFADIWGRESEDRLIFLDGTVVPEERPAADEKQEDRAELYSIPPGDKQRASVPGFSRREQLARIALDRTSYVERAFVNRIWALLLGRGLVHPVDRMDSSHEPSHPELLDWLSRDFRRSGFDVRRLVREIVLSRAYALDSRLVEASRSPPRDDLFARALEKPVSAETLWRNLLVATGNYSRAAKLPPPRELAERFPTVFHESYTADLRQALFLTNGPAIETLLVPHGDNTAARLVATENHEVAARLAFRLALGRAPDADELERARDYLDERRDRPEAARRQLLWALVTGPELVFSH